MRVIQNVSLLTNEKQRIEVGGAEVDEGLVEVCVRPGLSEVNDVSVNLSVENAFFNSFNYTVILIAISIIAIYIKYGKCSI